jgi:hypothetical protein
LACDSPAKASFRFCSVFDPFKPMTFSWWMNQQSIAARWSSQTVANQCGARQY